MPVLKIAAQATRRDPATLPYNIGDWEIDPARPVIDFIRRAWSVRAHTPRLRWDALLYLFNDHHSIYTYRLNTLTPAYIHYVLRVWQVSPSEYHTAHRGNSIRDHQGG